MKVRVELTPPEKEALRIARSWAKMSAAEILAAASAGQKASKDATVAQNDAIVALEAAGAVRSMKVSPGFWVPVITPLGEALLAIAEKFAAEEKP
jgi:hypothetical protein